MNRIFRNTIFYLLIFLVIIGVVSFFNGNNQPTEPISYDKFMQELEAGNVNGDLTLQPERGVYEVRGQLKGQEEGKGNWKDAAEIPNASEIPRPKKAGSSERMAVTGLEDGKTYYFAIKTKDKAGNISPLSNSPCVR